MRNGNAGRVSSIHGRLFFFTMRKVILNVANYGLKIKVKNQVMKECLHIYFVLFI